MSLTLARSNNAAELILFGDIGADPWGAASVSAERVAAELREIKAATITVRINSYGGSVADGLAIHSALRSHPARKVVTIEGVAVSIASLIAMAGDEVVMRPAALMMVHGPWSTAPAGNAKQARKTAESLDAHARAMAEAYSRKTGWSVDEVLDLLSDGEDHWFTADEAVEAGLADRIEAGDEAPAALGDAFDRYARSAPDHLRASLRTVMENTNVTNESNTQTKPAAGGAADPRAALRERGARIRAMVAGLEDHPIARRLTLDALSDPDMPLDVFGEKMLRALGSDVTPAMAGYRDSTHGDVGTDFVAAASDALVMRAGMKPAKPHPGAGDLRHASVTELARACVSRSGRTILGADSPAAIIRAAMGTSDFPLLLSNSLNKALRLGMEAETATHRQWCRLSNTRDFRSVHRLVLGSAPDLEQVLEQGEYTYGGFDEDRNSLVPAKFGKIVSLSWEAMLADDLGAFLGAGRALGQAAMRAEADVLYTALTTAGGAGQTLGDTVTLFDATRNNTVSVATGTGKPLTATALGQARSKLRRQTALGGGILNLAPRVLLVPPEREHEAEVLVAASTVHVSAANAEAATPAWLGGLVVIAEPRLTGTDVVYLIASRETIDCGEVVLVDDSPSLTEDTEFNRDAMSWKIRHAFAAGFVDFRGIVKMTLTVT